jgi:hypothetical protein
MENRSIAVKIEFGYADIYFNEGTDLTDAELKAFATDKFIEEITTLCERKDLRDYVYSSINNGEFTLSKTRKVLTKQRTK